MPTAIKIDISISPLNLAGGLIKMYKSRNEPSRGPMFYADIKFLPVPSVDIRASGYVSLAGIIEREASLKISNTEFILELYGRFFLFDATLRVHAAYGSLQRAAFQVYGLLSTEWMDELRKRVLAKISEAQKDADAKFNAAKREVDSAHSTRQCENLKTVNEK